MEGKRNAPRRLSRIVAGLVAVTGLAAVAGVLPPLATAPAAPAAVRNVLIVSPHPDDDVLIAAGIASRAKAAGATVKVAYMTNGDASGFNAGLPNGQPYGTLREGEAVNAQSYVGLPETDLLFLGYPDSYLSDLYGNYTRSTDQLTTSWGQSTTYAFRGLGSTDYHNYRFGTHAAYNAPNITQDLSTIMLTYRPDDIYTTAEFDQHSDHATSYWFTKKAIQQASASDATYSPVLHKSLVWSTDPASWPAAANPQSPHTQPPGLAGTGVTWAGRESVPVPAAMQNPDLSVNPKARAIDAHGSQGGVAGSDPNGFLGRFIHSDEFFWTEQQVPPSTGTVPPPTAGGWQFNGSAALSGSSLRLTPATANQAGSAFWPTVMSSTTLTADFDLTISGGTGADGMTFVLANPSAPTALGGTGGALGFAGIAGVAVTFDTYLNSGSADPSANFVGIATGYSGAVDHLTYAATSTAVPNLRSGTHHAKVVASSGRLKVSVDGTQYLDAAVTLPPGVMVGFTGGTGGLTDQHAVTNVAITSGTVAPAPVLSVSPGSLAFGSVVVGSSKVLPVTIANTGNAPLTMGTSTGPSAPFSATGLPANGTVIAAGASLLVNVTFAPTATTSSSGSLSIASNGGNASVSLSGTGTAVPTPVLSVSPGSLGFGSVVVGSSKVLPVTIANTGNAPLTMGTSTGPSAPFSASGLPANGTVIAAGASVQVNVTFAPTATTSSSGSLSIASNGGNASVSLSGTGVPVGSGTTVPPPTAGGWQFNGSAALSGSSLRLTPATADQAGSAFWPTAVSSAAITADFDFTISGGTGADGMTFVLANPSGGPTALGDNGGALGFAGIAGVAVTFDTYLNSGSADPSANFVGIATGYSGATDHLTYAGTSTAVPNLKSGTHHAKVVTNAGHLIVSVDGTQYLDVAVTLPSNVLVGFTGGTGGLTDQHAVTNAAITAS
ncbi:MAG: choice-of-anchor D domain-containing protein [Acidimicrobiia bacterium]